METITTTSDLAEYCAQAADFDYVTVDTEFLRERTYYSRLCLVQLAHPGEGDAGAVLVDPLAPGIDLEPLYKLFLDERVTKVFHAARQDLEIFYHARGIFPRPFFDTQVAAMVCGFGEQVGYETLVRKIARASLDKSSRFTDWSARPLSDKQKAYALADVTHLRVIYESLRKKLDKSGRTPWVAEEVETLLNPDTYDMDPAGAWRRLKTRTNSRRFLGYVRELARFREEYAQARDIPRNRVIKDDALMELAATKPRSIQELGKSRLLLREARKGAVAEGLIEAVARAETIPDDALPTLPASRQKPSGQEALADLLRVLLKARADAAGVAQKLIATSQELDELPGADSSHPVYRGWRNEVFGRDARALCEGRIALAAKGSRVEVVEL
ncbi:MAG: ribonuclease D [Pseudomonadota bacterium]